MFLFFFNNLHKMSDLWESNPLLRLGKPGHYLYTKVALLFNFLLEFTFQNRSNVFLGFFLLVSPLILAGSIRVAAWALVSTDSAKRVHDTDMKVSVCNWHTYLGMCRLPLLFYHSTLFIKCQVEPQEGIEPTNLPLTRRLLYQIELQGLKCILL